MTSLDNTNIPTYSDEAVSIAKINEVLKSNSTGENRGWDRGVSLDDIKLISAISKPIGKTVFEFTADSRHLNGQGNVHGGCIATIFDNATTATLVPISKPGFWSATGVTRTLIVTYLKPVKAGMTVILESEVVNAGKRLCTIKGVMKNKKDNSLLAICEHGKVNIDGDLGIGPRL